MIAFIMGFAGPMLRSPVMRNIIVAGAVGVALLFIAGFVIAWDNGRLRAADAAGYARAAGECREKSLQAENAQLTLEVNSLKSSAAKATASLRAALAGADRLRVENQTYADQLAKAPKAVGCAAPASAAAHDRRLLNRP
jgi:hypothetical protein